MFYLGDKVKIRSKSRWYREGDVNNPIDTIGTVIEVYSDYDNIIVLWANGKESAYSKKDLKFIYKLQKLINNRV